MRAIFGVVSLLVVVAVVGVLASRQLKAVNAATGAAPAGAATVPAGNVREQSQQLQQRVMRDVAGALQQGAERSSEQADK
jgi:hypothetical protein